MVRQIVTASVIPSVMSITVPALAQQLCAPYADVEKTLQDSKYHEHPVARALTNDGLVVIFAAKDGATWTVVLVRPKDQMACVGAVGTDWTTVADAGTGS